MAIEDILGHPKTTLSTFASTFKTLKEEVALRPSTKMKASRRARSHSPAPSGAAQAPRQSPNAALRQPRELLLFDLTGQAPPLGKLALPLAAYPFTFCVVVLLGVGELLFGVRPELIGLESVTIVARFPGS